MTKSSIHNHLVDIVFAALTLAILVGISIPLLMFSTDKEPPSMTAKPDTVDTLGASSQAYPTAGYLGYSTEESNDLGGSSQISGQRIVWISHSGLRGGNSQGSTPLEVLNATAARLRHLQNTLQSSNDQAKALFQVEKAIEALQGKPDIAIPLTEAIDQP